jgi:hypothetical protein
MKRRVAYRVTCGFAVGAAAVAVACSSSTSPHRGTPCPTYSGGSATPATVEGDYTLVSFCQDTLPAFGPPAVTGTLTLTAVAPDSFKALITITNQSPLPLAGPYSLSHDTITVTLPAGLGTFTGTYNFASHVSADTLFVSGALPGSPPSPIAIVFAK